MRGFGKVEDLDIYRICEGLSDRFWVEVDQWEHFARDTVGKQLVRAIDSVGANIAESHGRYYYRDKLNFLYYARGSI